MDLTKLPLSPLEGFVLSRIDGLAPLLVLADLTNLDAAEVEAIVERLIDLGAAEWARESVSLPRATGRGPTRTPSTPLAVPGSLRATPAARVNVPRPIRPASERDSTYKNTEPAEEQVDPARRSVLPGATPRASHTGTLHPAGELEELDALGGADTLPPPGAAPSEPRPREAAGAHDPGRDAAAPPSAGPPAGAEPPPQPAEPSAPREEEEALDLDPERRRRIDELFVALELIDHYRLLGVPRDAKREDVRNAYFTLSKVFHPDTMFRKRLGPYKAKMEAIFISLTEAYEVLGKKRSRQEYDRYLELSDRTRAVEEALEPEPAPSPDERTEEASGTGSSSEAGRGEGIDVARAQEPRAPGDEQGPQELGRARGGARQQTAARELMAKKLRAAVRASEAGRRSGRAAVNAPSEPPPVGRGHVLRDLASSLRASASHTGGLEPAQRHALNARRAEREGDLAEAARELRIAMELEPGREELEREHARVSAQLAAWLSTTYEERARYEQRHGKWAAAAISWAKVVEGRPDDAQAARNAAEAMIEAKGDLHRAKELAQRAADLAPSDPRCLRTLGRVYIAAGLKLNARRVLERAATLDPRDEMVENLLRDLDG